MRMKLLVLWWEAWRCNHDDNRFRFARCQPVNENRIASNKLDANWILKKCALRNQSRQPGISPLPTRPHYYTVKWTTWPYSPEDGASKHVIERVSDLCHWQLGMHQRTSMTLLLKWFHPRVFAFGGVGGLLVLLLAVMWRRGEYSECGRLASVSRQIQARTAGRHPTITILDSIWFDSFNPSNRQSTS